MLIMSRRLLIMFKFIKLLIMLCLLSITLIKDLLSFIFYLLFE